MEQATTKPRSRWPQLLALAALVVVLGIGIVGCTPLLDEDLSGAPAPANDHAAAMELADELLARDGDDIRDVCRSRVLEQGGRTDESVVLLHGFTNCPAQFAAFAQAYADAGYNVVVPRLPEHGYEDRLTAALSDLTPGDIVATTDLAVDIAAGLGDRVTVVGLSAGGTAAGWAAATRDDVDEAVLVAPLVLPQILPRVVVEPVARLSAFAPDVRVWWDRDLKAELDDPPYAYPRFSVRSLGAFLAVGYEARNGVSRTTDLERLLLVTNEHDPAVNNDGAEALSAALETVAIDREEYRFRDELGLGHDLVDPQGENAERIPEIYPVLSELMDLPELATIAPAPSN